jgi:hypothetical protein
MFGPNPQIAGPEPRTSGFFNPWFLSVDMEILTPYSSHVHPEVQPKDVQATEGC